MTTRFTARPRLEALEDRAVPAFGFGWAFAYGGPDHDTAAGVATDAAGNVYVAGSYNSGTGDIDFDPGPGTALLNSGGAYHSFAAKYQPSGALQWVRDLGPRNVGTGIALRNADLYVAHGSADGATTLFRLDAASGNPVWAAPVQFADASPNGVAVGASGNVYVAGINTSSQAYVAKVDALGTVAWTRTTSGGSAVLGNAYDTLGNRVALDAAENVFVTGTYSGTVGFGPGAATLTSWSGTPDAFVWKLSAGGGSVWAGSMGSVGSDYGLGVAVDGGGNVVVTGEWGYSATYSAKTVSQNNDFNPASGTTKLTNNGSYDIFVAKLVPGAGGSLALSWAKGVGGNGDLDQGVSVAVDAAGRVYTTGYFSAAVDFDPGPQKSILTSAGAVDIYVWKLNADGSFAAAAGMGGEGYDYVRSIAVDGSNNVYAAGAFRLYADFDPSPGTFNLTVNGGTYYQDGFVAKLTQGSPLRAAGGSAAGKATPLTDAQLRPIVAAAIDRWAAAGLDAGRLDVMRHTTVTIGDLGGSYLGLADTVTHGIRIDDDAAGRGWFVDPSPADDREFGKGEDMAVKGRMDLLSAITHELGHVVGLDHADHGVMGESLSAGTRVLPTTADLIPLTPRRKAGRH